MQLVTIDEGAAGTPGARLPTGQLLHLGRAALPGTIEAWLPDTLLAILEAGDTGLDVVRRMVERTGTPAEAERLAQAGALLPGHSALRAPLPRPGMILAAGLAYRSHLAEMSGTPTPRHPTAFLKAPSSVSAPGATVRLPPQAPARVDYEGELAVVFGRECHAVEPEEAMTYVAGYAAANDLSARDWVEDVWAATAPWEARTTWEVNIMGKQLPGFTALGPAIVTTDEVPDPSELTLRTFLNGELMQEAPVSDLIFPIAETIAWFSRWYTFRPGDVMLTGTPAGVGVGRSPQAFIRPGDTVSVEIDRIGRLETHFET